MEILSSLYLSKFCRYWVHNNYWRPRIQNTTHSWFCCKDWVKDYKI